MLGRQVTAFKTSHLSPMREREGLLRYIHPEVINHPEQAYLTTEVGRAWLAENGIRL
ncbi:hypothetical protein ACFSVK_16680 [Azorhizophilus paspali]|uniref:Uncharacterized protein n=1 Tax=Azorhizophilus paspali TaxID=69963 RepID=A0ABV6SN08_AZOPA